VTSFQSPIIVYWDISPSAGEELLFRIADEIVSSKVLVLHLTDLSPELGLGTRRALERLAGDSPRVVLTARSSALRHADILRSLGLRKLYVHLDALDEAVLERIGLLAAEGFDAGVSFDVSANSLESIPSLLALCIRDGISDVHFPIKRAEGEGGVFIPDPRGMGRLSSGLEGLELGGLNITLHEPFLHGVFSNGGGPAWQGCQGANTMAYISEGLDVTPCPLLTLSMGNLNSLRLEEVFSSPRRMDIRESLSAAPSQCAECEDAPLCKGGCRGRTFTLFGTMDRRDPGCPAAGR